MSAREMDRPHPDEGRAAHEAIVGSGLPATSAKNVEGICTGAWACDIRDGGSHCCCWWDAPVPGPRLCCQCGASGGDTVPPVAGVDYERASCPVCGDPDCTFPPACQDAIGVWPSDEDDDE